MGLRIFTHDPGSSVPRAVHLTLECDGDHRPRHLFDEVQQERQTFTESNYVEQRSAAVRAGWRFSVDGKVYGPCCSSKHVFLQSE